MFDSSKKRRSDFKILAKNKLKNSKMCIIELGNVFSVEVHFNDKEVRIIDKFKKNAETKIKKSIERVSC